MNKKVKREGGSFKDSGKIIFENDPNPEFREIIFYPSSKFDPLGGFIDYYQCVPQLEFWIKQVQNWFQNKKGHPLLVINGFVKVGKSTVLDIIPQLLPDYFTDFQICRLSFEIFPIKTAFDFFTQLYDSLSRWSLINLKVQVILPLQQTIGAYKVAIIDLLATISKQYAGTVFYLFDEIQRWFQLPFDELEKAVVFAFFKDMVGNYERQYFVVTGSGMATAWNAFLKAPPNGHRLANTIISLDIPELCNESTLKWCATKLSNSDHLLPFVKNPAQLIFIHIKLSTTVKVPSNDDELDKFIQNEIDEKYIEEFVQDMLPLLEKIDKAQRVYMRQLALGIATDTPKGIWSHYLNNFVDDKIPIDEIHSDMWKTETNNTPIDQKLKYFVGLRSSLFSTLMKMFINSDGELNPSTLREWNTNNRFPISIRQYRLLDDLYQIASKCENINPVWKGTPINDPTCQTIENECTALFKQYNFELNLNSYQHHKWFQVVFTYAQQQYQAKPLHNNYDQIDKNIINHTRGPTFNFWYCTLLKLTRNYLAHKGSDFAARKTLVDNLPSWTPELITVLAKKIPDLNFLQYYAV